MRLRALAIACAGACLLAAGAGAQLFEKRGRLLPVGHNPGAIAIGDLTDDDLPDLVTADRGALEDPREERPANDELSVLIAKPGLDYVKLHPSPKTDFAPYAVAIANIDALRWPDIVVVNFLASRQQDVSLCLNLRTEDVFKAETFRVPDEGLAYVRHFDGDSMPLFTVPGLTALAIEDFDGDGLRDLAATAWSCDRLAYFPGHAETHFGAPLLIDAPGGPSHLCAASLDGQGGIDLAVAMQSTNEIAIFSGDPAARFVERTRFPSRGRLPVRVAAADLNRDDVLDLVVAHRYTDDNLVVFYGDGGAQYGVSQEIMLGKDRAVLEHEIRDLVAADFNGDGRTDLSAACHASGEVQVLINVSDTKEKAQRFRTETYTFEGGRPRALAAADLDADGALDLAVTLWGLDAVGLLINRKK